jgi:diguanylate cyclase (GGDEF)-like protein
MPPKTDSAAADLAVATATLPGTRRRQERPYSTDPMRSFVRLLSENLTIGLLVLSVVVVSDQVHEPWHSMANVAVAVALVAYAIRLTLSQYRQQKELRVRQRAESNLLKARDQLDHSFQDVKHRAVELNQLTELGQLLQSCVSEAEAYTLVGTALNKFLPDCSGALYTVLPGGQRVELISEWGCNPPVEKVFDPAECWSVRRGRTHSGNRGATPVNCAHLALGEKETSLCIPLITHGEISGILVLLRYSGAAPVSDDRWSSTLARTRRVGTALAEQMALTLANLHLRTALREQAIRDPLTGLFNRRYLEETLERELQHAIRRNRPVSVLMLDLDHFKRCNDKFGHDAGDLVLRSVGEFLRCQTRAEDIACRYGGEEFVVVMPEATAEDALVRAQQIREGIKQLPVKHEARFLDPTTISVGLACTSQGLSDTGILMKAADAALYRAKHEGRDRVVVSEQVTRVSKGTRSKNSARRGGNGGLRARPRRSHSEPGQLTSSVRTSPP